MKVLVSGTAGFIGSHVAIRLMERGDEVVGIDNMSDYNDVDRKKARHARFLGNPRTPTFTPTSLTAPRSRLSSPPTSRNA